MGRIAVISDLHANLEATAAVLRDAEVRDVSEVLCAGDLVNYGPDPNGVVEFVRSRAIPSVMGNHDLAATFALQPADIRIGPGRNAQAEVESYQWTVAQLSLANKEFLARRPRVIRKRYGGHTVVLFHATPSSLTEYLVPQTKHGRWVELAEELYAAVVLMGHSHLPFSLGVDGTLFCNPGSVGKPIDGDARASYGILSLDPVPSFELVRVAYDVGRTAGKIRRAGMPELLATGLEEARAV